MSESWSVTHRERLELLTAALIPAVMGLPGLRNIYGVRVGWLLPLLALPVGLAAARIWHGLGPEGLPGGIDRALGNRTGLWLRGLYLLWGVWLLARYALSCTDRLLAAAQLPVGRWPLLAVLLLLTLWLGQSRGRAVRSGRIFYLTAAVTLGAVGLLALPSLRWENLLPLEAAPKESLKGGMAVLSLTGCGIYGLCLPLRGECRERNGWIGAVTLGLSAMIFVVTGAFGPSLAAQLDQPFLYILKGVGVPGAFQRGEAVLAAVLALADLVLLELLAQGCSKLLAGITWGRYAALGAGGALAIWMGVRGNSGIINGEWQIYGGIIMGLILPGVLLWMGHRRKRQAADTIYCG